MLKNKIFQYFFIEFFKIFLLVTLSFSLLIWFTQAARLLELVTEYGNPIEIYGKYMLYSFPKILDNTYLISFIISFLFLFAKLETEKEIQIYWLSGVSKFKIYYNCLIIGLLVLIINLVISNLLAPWSSYKGRLILGESKFTLVNTLVKEKNFNSPLKGLTIYVENNDKRGNLNGIFIYEKNRTITAQTGQVISNGEKTFLKLFNGTSQENIKGKINFVKFEETIFDFSKFELKNTIYPKFSERSLKWLINNLNKTQHDIKRRMEIREEINSRTIKPLIILIITSLISLSLFSNNEKFNLKKLKIIIYIFSVLILILNQILLGISGKNSFFTYCYILFLLIIFVLQNILFKKFLKFESSK